MSLPALPPSSAERMEAVFFRLYSGIIVCTTKWTSPLCRSLIEATTLINALAVLCILLWLHVKYVTRAQESCVTSLLHREIQLAGASNPLIKIQINGIWNQLGLEDDSPKLSTFKQEMLHQKQLDLLDVWLQDPTFLFSTERAFLSLDAAKRKEFNIQESFIALNTDQCFRAEGSWFGEAELFLLTNFIGWDTVILNALACRFDHGSLFSMHSREILTIQSSTLPFWFKFTAVCTTLFLFCITTTLVHHTLRETQERMLNFTFDLHVLVNSGASFRNLVFNHLMGSLAFVPIMVGMLFFLFEFYNDQLLAFMVMSIVWVCELYSVVCLRTKENVTNFPKLFFLYFCSFHLYFFLFPTGFSYTALTCCVVFLQFAMWSFFIRFEMPAYLSGRISAERRRDIVQASAASLAIQAVTHQPAAAPSVRMSSPPLTAVTMVSSPRRTDETTPTPSRPNSAQGTGGRKKRSTIHNPPAESDLQVLQDAITTMSSPESARFREEEDDDFSILPPAAYAIVMEQQQQERSTRNAWEAESQSSSGDWQIGHE